MNSHAVTPLLARLHLSGLAGDPNEIAEALLAWWSDHDNRRDNSCDHRQRNGRNE